MISCLNNDALEKRLKYPGGWRGGINGHGAFGANPLVQSGVCRALGCIMFQKWGAVGQVGAIMVHDGMGGGRAAQPPRDQKQQQQLNVDQILS